MFCSPNGMVGAAHVLALLLAERESLLSCQCARHVLYLVEITTNFTLGRGGLLDLCDDIGGLPIVGGEPGGDLAVFADEDGG